MENQQQQQLQELRNELNELREVSKLEEELKSLKREAWKLRNRSLVNSWHDAKLEIIELLTIFKNWIIKINNQKGVTQNNGSQLRVYRIRRLC